MSIPNYTMSAITPIDQVTAPRLVLLLKDGFRLVRECRGRGREGLDRAENWDVEVLDKLVNEVLPWNGVLLTEINLSLAILMSFTNIRELRGRYRGKISKIVIHDRPYIDEVINLGRVGATIHIISNDWTRAFPNDNFDRLVSRMLMERAGIDISASECRFDHLPTVFARGVASDFHEIIFAEFQDLPTSVMTAQGFHAKI